MREFLQETSYGNWLVRRMSYRSPRSLMAREQNEEAFPSTVRQLTQGDVALVVRHWPALYWNGELALVTGRNAENRQQVSSGSGRIASVG
jgi:hypothetical protein